MGYLIKINNNGAKIIKPKSFDKEEPLQEIIKRHPELIPLEEIDENFKPLLVIGREFSLENAGSIDLLAIDTLGVITLIEFKLEKNADIRKVVAQTIEYAANLWEMSYDVFDEKVKAYFNSDRCEINELKGKTLAQSIQWHHQRTKSEDDGEFSIEDFMKSVSSNLQKGEFRLIIFSDQADDRIKRAVEYLNELSDFDIYCATTELYEEKGDKVFKSTFITRDRKGLSSRKKYAGKISFYEFLRSFPDEFKNFAEAYGIFNEKKNEVYGYCSMGTKGFAAYFPVGENKIRLFEGYPTFISLLSKRYFERINKEEVLVPEEAIENYEKGISKIAPFKDSFQFKGVYPNYKYDQFSPSDLIRYFEFIISWYKESFWEGPL
jgi:hypothetical protein